MSAYQFFSSTEVLCRMVMSRRLVGLSIRSYQVGMEPDPGRCLTRVPCATPILSANARPTIKPWRLGVGPDTATEMVVIVGDNPERIRSEAAFAKIAGVPAIPASSGNHQATTESNAAGIARPTPPLSRPPDATPRADQGLRRPPEPQKAGPNPRSSDATYPTHAEPSTGNSKPP